MPWGDILNFDENLCNNCGKDYYMKGVIESQKKKEWLDSYYFTFLCAFIPSSHLCAVNVYEYVGYRCCDIWTLCWINYDL
jgi:hypothetical protein